MAATNAEDREYDMKLSLRSIFSGRDIRQELFVDARELFATINALHEPLEYRLRKTVDRMLDAFESGDLECDSWIDDKSNLADALTKGNVEVSQWLNVMLARGIWDNNLNVEWSV